MEATKMPEQEAPQEVKKRRLPALKLPKKRKKWIRRAALLLVAALGIFWFTHRGGGGTGAALAGQYVPDTVQRRDVTASVSGTGTVTPIDSYQLRSLVPGEVLEAPFEVGDRVEKGQLLYRLDAKEAQMGIEQAQLSVRQAQKNYDDLARNLTVTAPASGVIQKMLVRKGDLVTPGTPIAEIADSSRLTLSLPFHSADAGQIAPGQSAQVTVAGTLETLPAVVESVSSADLTGPGGTLVRQVRLRLDNPGALTTASSATAVVGEIACAGSGNFEESLRQTILASASGEVVELPVSAGDKVSAGSTVAVLGGDAARSTLEDLSIALENARLSLQRAQDTLENYTITAPISGTVIEKNVKAGDKVDGVETGALAVIYDLSYLKLEMNISELDLNKIQTGQRVDITADAIPGQVFEGTVDRVSINGTTTNGFTTYPATILLEEYGGLNPGMNVSADIVVEQVANALTIPASAVQRGDTVLVPLEGALAEDGVTVADPSKVEERTVTLGGSDGTYVEITSGLSEGNTVLVPAQAEGGGMAAAGSAGG